LIDTRIIAVFIVVILASLIGIVWRVPDHYGNFPIILTFDSGYVFFRYGTKQIMLVPGTYPEACRIV